MGRTNNTSLRGNEVQYPVSLYNLRQKIVHGNNVKEISVKWQISGYHSGNVLTLVGLQVKSPGKI